MGRNKDLSPSINERNETPVILSKIMFVIEFQKHIRQSCTSEYHYDSYLNAGSRFPANPIGCRRVHTESRVYILYDTYYIAFNFIVQVFSSEVLNHRRCLYFKTVAIFRKRSALGHIM